eukprot:CAMPEP_0171469278 /NCGR_PEP_ID=MMETSP0945-20130129/11188_1 /TAXON_ID=109269 /ORGANISM="Vaucheria litorea, Strain CCMP2940" /LENGTH=322 /DNA_ID=CAMNT_0011998389 /DNA_START=379 /DNA_END=1347 /DNA_ORIENTATION=+
MPKEKTSQGEKAALLSPFFASNKLSAHAIEQLSPLPPPQLNDSIALKVFAHPKVGDDSFPFAGQKNISAAEISVEDLVPVQVLHSPGDVADDFVPGKGAKVPLPRKLTHRVLQISHPKERCEKRDFADGARAALNLQNVRVLQSRERVHFSGEPQVHCLDAFGLRWWKPDHLCGARIVPPKDPVNAREAALADEGVGAPLPSIGDTWTISKASSTSFDAASTKSLPSNSPMLVGIGLEPSFTFPLLPLALSEAATTLSMQLFLNTFDSLSRLRALDLLKPPGKPLVPTNQRMIYSTIPAENLAEPRRTRPQLSAKSDRKQPI